MFGGVRGSPGGPPGAEGGIQELSEGRGRNGMGKGTKQAWATICTQDNWELPVVQGISDKSPIAGGGLP